MEEELIKAVRLKALDQGASNSKLGIAKQVISEIDISISEKAFTNYLKSIAEGKEVTISKEIRESLARYLAFESYVAFKESLQKGKSVERKYVFIIFVLIGCFIVTVVFINRKKCMIWQGNQYVKIHCEEANAKPIDQRLLVNFRKVEPACKEDFFFKEDKTPRVWYYKKGKNDLELFTMPGEHPINGKTLDDITEYMVTQHLCARLYR